MTPAEVEVRAAAPAGVFYGLQTFRQLLPPAVFRARRAARRGVAWKAPCVEIEDRPRFSWRGSHLDVGRHFQPKETILKHLDLLALHKLNVFHWHLTEDQGWRIEIKKYPKLTEVGAWRKDSALGPPPPKDKDGKHAPGVPRHARTAASTPRTTSREVVRYAADRFITVVPEIEMPGHARAAIAAYPELGNTGKPVEVATTWGVFKRGLQRRRRDPRRSSRTCSTEVLALFPSKFIHIGGDEVPKDEWKASPAAQARMKALGLKNEDELQSWFIKQIDAWLTEQGRRLIGWDEILQGGLAPGAAVMSWRGERGRHRGGQGRPRRGHGARASPTYFDYLPVQGPAASRSPSAATPPLEKVYAYDPIPGRAAARAGQTRAGRRRRSSGPNTCPTADTWSTWPGRGCARWPRWCGRRAKARDFARFKARLAARTWSGWSSWT